MDITVKSAAAWFFGIIFIISGLGMTSETIVGGLISAMVGIFLIPNIRQVISERFDINFSTWMVVLIAVVGMGISGAMMPTDEAPTDTTPEVNNQPEQDQEQPSDISNTEETNQTQDSNTSNEENTKESRTHSIGENFKVGKLSYTVTDVNTRQLVGTNRYLREEADGEFVLVDIEITNEGQESTTISNSHLTLADSQERSYSVDSDAFAAVENSFTFEQLDPGLSKEGILVYDTPPRQEGRKLKVSPSRIFSTSEPRYVNLEG